MEKFFNEKDASRAGKLMLALGFFLTCFVATLFIHEMRAVGLMNDDITKVSTIDVSGSGDVVAIPDTAEESFTVEQKDATITAAQATVSKKVADVMAFLKKSGIAEKDIKTTNYTANPEYSYPNPCYSAVCPTIASAPKLLDYLVSETITIKMHDTTKVGTIVDGLGSLGVTGLSGPTFTVADTDQVMADARKKAIDDAKTKADKLADDLGVRLVRIVRYTDSTPNAYPVAMYAKAMDASVGSAPVAQLPAGENKYTSNVTITYEIR